MRAIANVHTCHICSAGHRFPTPASRLAEAIIVAFKVIAGHNLRIESVSSDSEGSNAFLRNVAHTGNVFWGACFSCQKNWFLFKKLWSIKKKHKENFLQKKYLSWP